MVLLCYGGPSQKYNALITPDCIVGEPRAVGRKSPTGREIVLGLGQQEPFAGNRLETHVMLYFSDVSNAKRRESCSKTSLRTRELGTDRRYAPSNHEP